LMPYAASRFYCFSTAPPTSALYTLSLHDALPISVPNARRLGEYVATAFRVATTNVPGPVFLEMPLDMLFEQVEEREVVAPEKSRDRKSTRLNSSHVATAYAVFCLKKKKRFTR